MHFKFSDEKEEGDMLACQLESDEKMEEETKTVTIEVTIEKELLRRVDSSGLHFITQRQTGERSTKNH